MLAYVFWHWPQADIDRDAYVDHLSEFQQTLAANKPDGFQQSVVFRIRGASWLNTTTKLTKSGIYSTTRPRWIRLTKPPSQVRVKSRITEWREKQQTASVACIVCAQAWKI